MNGNSEIPGMLYRSVAKNRADIDALRHLGGREGRIKIRRTFVPLQSWDWITQSHESAVIAKVDCERLLADRTRRQRQIIQLQMEGYRPREIAKLTGKACATVKATFWQTMNRMREEIKESK